MIPLKNPDSRNLLLQSSPKLAENLFLAMPRTRLIKGTIKSTDTDRYLYEEGYLPFRYRRVFRKNKNKRVTSPKQKKSFQNPPVIWRFIPLRIKHASRYRLDARK